MIKIALSPAEIHEALHIAERRYERHRGNRHARYRNLPHTHLHGALGEISFREWLRREKLPYRAPCLDENEALSLPDFLCGHHSDDLSIGIEVKTWDTRHWQKWGRCISVEQLPSLRKKGVHIIVWATVALERGPASRSWQAIKEHLRACHSLRTTLWGWHRIEEVETWGPPKPTGPEGNEVLNYQAPDAGRCLFELRGLLKGS